MKFHKNLLLLCCAVFLSACFEIKDEITLEKDGSGNYTRVYNFKETLFDEQGETQHAIDSIMNSQMKIANASIGISAVMMEKSADQKVYTLHFHFAEVKNLNSLFNKIEDYQHPNTEDYFTWNKKSFTVNGGIPGIVDANFKKTESGDDEDNSSAQMIMEAAKYSVKINTSKKIKSVSNKNYYVFKGGKGTSIEDITFQTIMENSRYQQNVIRFK